MITCTRKLRFCAGHRVHGHESKCAHLHGHDYGVEVTAIVTASKHGGRSLDDLGRVVDFSVLKERIGTWLDDTWDHRLLLWDQDPTFEGMMSLAEEEDKGIVRVPFNPTAENIATHIGSELCPKLLDGTGVEVVRAVVHETPNCFATWEK